MKKAVEQRSRENGTNIHPVCRLAEKLSALQRAEFLANRRARANFQGFGKLMMRRGGKRPVPVMRCRAA